MDGIEACVHKSRWELLQDGRQPSMGGGVFDVFSFVVCDCGVPCCGVMWCVVEGD